jgi:putative modified peptide
MGKMANTPARGGGTPLDPKLADRLLDLLSSDNAFRRQFKKDPQAALASLGATPTKACASVKAIAPKQEIAASRDALRTQMLAAGIFSVPHCFEAGKVASSLRRK